MEIEQISIFEQGYYEQKTESIDLNELGFKIHASLIYKLGNELISNEIIAISELVKNAYDADSLYVKLLVDPSYVDVENGSKGKIEIKDEGCGMGLSDIVNGWLTISNSKKRKMKRNKEVTPKYKRVPLGDKGLGRLSVQRLGKKMIMVTKKENSNMEYSIEIPWGEFKKNTTIENINVKCSERKISDLGGIEKGYTNLIITDLENINMWCKKDNIDALENELSKIVSPFKKDDSSFYIYAKVGERELDFSGISDEIFDMATDKYEFNINKNSVTIKGNYKMDFLINKNLLFKIKEDHVNEFFHNKLSKFENYKLDFQDMYCLKFEEKFDLIDIGDMITDEINDRSIIHPGNFSGEIFSYYLEPNYVRDKFNKLDFKYFDEASEIGEYVATYKGIKVFRDDFRIMPYGEGDGGDWLGLSTGQGTTGRYIDLKNNNVIGYVKLSGKNNYALYEKTNREGFMQDTTFLNFQTIMKAIITRINRNRRLLSDEFRKYAKGLIVNNDNEVELPSHVAATNKVKDISVKANNMEQKLNELNSKLIQTKTILSDENRSINNSNISENEKNQIKNMFNKLEKNLNESSLVIHDSNKFFNEIENLNNQMKVVEEDYNIFLNQIETITELAGLGMAAETLTHELYTIIKNIKTNTEEITKYFENKFPVDKKISRYFNFILFSSESIRKQVGHLAPGLKNVRTTKRKIDILELLKVHKNVYQNRAERKGINIDIINASNTFIINASEGMILQVLDNMYINSEYWLEHAKKLGKVTKLEFVIDIKGDGIINIWDSGLGIDKTIQNHIFEPFVSNKKDGRGLGLYIISKLLNYHKATIRLVRELNEFGNLFKFEIDLSKCLSKEE